VTKKLSKVKVLTKDGEKLFHELIALNPKLGKKICKGGHIAKGYLLDLKKMYN
jgi:hypothetical protein